MPSFCRAVAFAVLTVLIVPRPALAEPAWTWPIALPHEVARPFDKPAENWLPGHRGVDLASTAGTTVVSAGPGRVFFAGEVGGKQVVSVEHVDGLRTTYEPVDASVSTGDEVAGGDPIGVLLTGHAGCDVAACLHWGLRRDGDYLDPMLLVAPRKLRLKPL